jgi:thiol:disulfide interchange protein DsbD
MVEQFIQGLSVTLPESFFLAYLTVYLGGVLVSFTPCVYPVIPITIAFIGARGGASRGRGFLLSVVYVLGMAVTYTALGGVAALSGKLFGQLQTNPWIYFVMANLCLIMGLSMLGVFVLPFRTPQFIARIQPREQTQGLASSFLVGAASGLVMGPCTAPVLAVLLGYVATRQNPLYAMSLLFIFSIGMGTLLVILGTFAGLLANLPKSGPWMEKIGHLFGWLMIAAGEYFLIQAGILWG